MSEDTSREAASQQKNKADVLRAIAGQFATTVKRIYINSMKTEVGFREIKVSEQKTMSRIMIDNEQRKDIIYDSQCALINQVSLSDGFDIYNLTEFDKIKLLMALYQSNMHKNEITFKCKECGTDNKYEIDFTKVLKRLDDFDISDKQFKFENDSWKFDFTIGYPSVRRVSDFYKSYAKKYRQASPREMESLNNIINMDYINTYVKSFRLLNKQTSQENEIDLSEYSSEDVTALFSEFPQDVLYVDDGVLNFIANEFIGKLNDAFDKHKCLNCGTLYEEAIDKDTQSFF